jgi:hypothetical protein
MVLKLKVIPGTYAVCRLDADAAIPDWALTGSVTSVTRTSDELSIVCPEAQVPKGVRCENGWRCIKVHGPLPFSMTGVLASLVNPLAEAGISLFAFSTYDTDYVLVPEAKLDDALAALSRAGHEIKK